MSIAKTVSEIDELHQLREDLNNRLAYVIAARNELEQTRSDIISELGNSPNDNYLKCRFVAGLDAADARLRRALL